MDRILSDAESDANVSAAMTAYTRRTDLPPVEGVCECYTDWTGLRIPLRRPCPVHGTTSSHAMPPVPQPEPAAAPGRFLPWAAVCFLVALCAVALLLFGIV